MTTTEQPSSTELETLDHEIQSIRSRINDIKKRRSNLTSILLSAPHLPRRLQQRPGSYPVLAKKALKVVEAQSKRNLENVYRTCAGITAFKVQDPDPNAVDDGNVLGIRIEVFVDGSFLPPYHIFLVRPYSEQKETLKIHRHTIPTCIPLASLASKYLPQPSRSQPEPSVQNMKRLILSLRQELTSYHLRKSAIEKLRVKAGLSSTGSNDEDKAPAMGKVVNAVADSEDEDESDDEITRPRRTGPKRITDITSDAAVHDVFIEWSDGQVAKIKVSKDGSVERGVVRNSDGYRESELERKAAGRIEALLEKLQ